MTEQPLHVVVLAGGEGTRLASLTRALYGIDLPKQFAVLADNRSLMQATIDRALALTSIDLISVIISAHHEQLARTQLARYPGLDIILQPRNLDTGPGLMLPLVRILARSPSARVVFLPSDHYVPEPAPLVAALRATAQGVLRDRVTLVGVAPAGPEVEYGWITLGPRLAPANAFAVHRFVEKPPYALAQELFVGGGLWNTFISTAPAGLLWALARRALPRQAEALEHYAAAIGGLDEARALEHAYRVMAPANFSHDVLARVDQLAVVPVAGTGWSDWGSPARVFASLAGTASHDDLVTRIRGDMAMAG